MSDTSLQAGRVYVRSKASQRSIMIALGFFAVFGLAMLVPMLTGGGPGKNPAPLAFIGVSTLAVVAIAYSGTRRFRVVLYPDRIHVRGFFDKTIMRSEIAGGRFDDRHNLLYLFGQNGRRLGSLDLGIERDAEFDRWLGDFPNLDTRDLADALTTAMKLDPRRPSPEEFVTGWEKTRRYFNWVMICVGGASLWFAIYPRPYLPLFLFALLTPPAALAVCSAFPTRVRFQTVPGWIGIDLVLIGPSIGLVARTLPDAHPFDWTRVPLLASVPTALLAAAVYRLATKNKVKTALAFSLFTGCYSFGLIALGNQLFDREIALTAEIRIVELRDSAGSRAPCTIVGEYAEGRTRRFDTNCASLAHLQVGQWVSIDVFDGAFGIPWWRWTPYSEGHLP